ncbi:hypothetical protein AVEN_16610-1, partial [Araneus ventricosus]
MHSTAVCRFGARFTEHASKHCDCSGLRSRWMDRMDAKTGRKTNFALRKCLGSQNYFRFPATFDSKRSTVEPRLSELIGTVITADNRKL